MLKFVNIEECKGKTILNFFPGRSGTDKETDDDLAVILFADGTYTLLESSLDEEGHTAPGVRGATEHMDLHYCGKRGVEVGVFSQDEYDRFLAQNQPEEFAKQLAQRKIRELENQIVTLKAEHGI